jgi:colanic acid biosynthesis glycosyl transferase WcaI
VHSSFATTEATLKILYISHYFPPEMGAPSARVSELSRHWANAGHQVTVLTGFPNHPDGIVRPQYRSRFRKIVCHELMDGIKVVRTWLLPFPNRKSHERMLNYSSFCLSSAIVGSFLERPDVVIATSPQLLVGLAGWWIARLKRSPFILEVRDLWPESLAAVGVSNSQSWLHRAVGRIAGFLYRAADHIVVVTPAFSEHLVSCWGVPEKKISVVQNGVETDIFRPLAPSQLRSRLNLPSKFIVSYIGTLGLAHGLETVLAAAESLQSRDPDVLFLLLGEGAERERIQAAAAGKKLANIRFEPQQPREKIPEYISASDACLVLLKKSAVFETVIPTKMLESMSCGRPVILGVRGQAHRLLLDARGGIGIPPEDPRALVAAIQDLMQGRICAGDLGRNGREYIVRNLSRRSTAAEYLRVLERLLQHERQSQAAAA